MLIERGRQAVFLPYGSFKESEAPLLTRNSRALVTKTPTNRTTNS